MGPRERGPDQFADQAIDRDEVERLPDFGAMALVLLGDAEAVASLAVSAPLPGDLFGSLRRASEVAQHTQGIEADPPVGALGRSLRLLPGAEQAVTFAIAWHFPNRREGHAYAARFSHIADLVNHLGREHEHLSAATRLWHDTYYDSSLPLWLLDRLHSTVSTLATSTCQWWKSGRFWAWEGVGCCHGTCGHVWNYAHAPARLFPILERSVREMQDFAPTAGFVAATGEIRFRGEGWGLWAGDAQPGYVLKAYREHQCSTSRAFLERNWPAIKQALEFLIKQDGNDDGLIEGKQHNTYDIDFYGPNTMVGSLYLAALRAGEELAREMNDVVFARRCRTLVEAGRTNSVAKLFNGEYFIQLVDLKQHDDCQYATGCLADQLFGQSWAHHVGLGHVYPRETVLAALRSIWRYNWAPDIAAQNEKHPPERWFARPGEAGLFTCTWPKSAHLGAKSVRYRDEVWTGIEYQVASHMVWEGMVEEALAICRGVHDRYHPSKHNPWNEVECGDHYARGMASWGVFTALCGFSHHGPHAEIGFAPRLQPGDFKAAFTAAAGWGTFTQKRTGHHQVGRIALQWGTLGVRELHFELEDGAQLRAVTMRLNGAQVAATVRQDGRSATVSTPVLVTLERGHTLEVGLELL
ncbi:MAG: GH116 family glycosyl hydrolase [Planctomycetota bacterium]